MKNLDPLVDNKTGSGTLKREIPWLTSASIIRLDELLTKDMRVLEFGCGGSTLFFGRRCKSVDSYESELKWFGKTSKAISKRKMTNIKMKHYENYRVLREKFSQNEYDCILIDNKTTVINRDIILHMCMPITSKLLVLDNYRGKGAFPLSRKLSVEEFMLHYLLEGYNVETYDSKFWNGGGTRIFIKGEKNERSI